MASTANPQRNDEMDARLAMASISGLGSVLTRRLEEAFGSAAGVMGASVQQLRRVDQIGERKSRDIREKLDAVDIEKQWYLIDQWQVTLIPYDDPKYPTLLKHIHDPPPMLFVRGQLQRSDTIGLAIVGSRRCSAYGRSQASRFAMQCAQAGMTIISGGARGIDAEAHRGALRSGGRTVAVLGCGQAECYPAEHKDLYDEIAAGHGAVISELPMDAPPLAENFPARNRIISGLSIGVLVVEAAVRSGALITARLAAEEHHREVMALPGRVDAGTSAGCHKMIREGWASLVTNAADVFDALGEAGRTLRAVAQAEPEDGPDAVNLFESSQAPMQNNVATQNLTEPQQAVYSKLSKEPISIDDLTKQADQPIHVVQATLTILEMRGVIQRLPGQQVCLR